jgi:hypothetical protein
MESRLALIKFQTGPCLNSWLPILSSLCLQAGTADSLTAERDDDMTPSAISHHYHRLLLPFPSPIQALNPFSTSPARFRHQLPKPIVLSLSLRPAFSSAFAVAAVDDDEDVVVGDCLVFDDDAFEEPDLDLPSSSPPPRASRYGRRAEARGGGGTGSLVPEKWRDAEEEINLTKKEKRRIAHGMRFGSRLERRAPPAVTAPDEFRAYRKGTLQAEREHVADVYRGPLERALPPEKVEEPPPPEPGTRVAPKNPRMGMDGGSLEDIAEFFSSREYASDETEDSKSPKSELVYSLVFFDTEMLYCLHFSLEIVTVVYCSYGLVMHVFLCPILHVCL